MLSRTCVSLRLRGRQKCTLFSADGCEEAYPIEVRHSNAKKHALNTLGQEKRRMGVFIRIVIL